LAKSDHGRAAAAKALKRGGTEPVKWSSGWEKKSGKRERG